LRNSVAGEAQTLLPIFGLQPAVASCKDLTVFVRRAFEALLAREQSGRGGWPADVAEATITFPDRQETITGFRISA
jgi:hypothetical protein